MKGKLNIGMLVFFMFISIPMLALTEMYRETRVIDHDYFCYGVTCEKVKEKRAVIVPSCQAKTYRLKKDRITTSCMKLGYKFSIEALEKTLNKVYWKVKNPTSLAIDPDNVERARMRVWDWSGYKYINITVVDDGEYFRMNENPKQYMGWRGGILFYEVFMKNGSRIKTLYEDTVWVSIQRGLETDVLENTEHIQKNKEKSNENLEKIEWLKSNTSEQYNQVGKQLERHQQGLVDLDVKVRNIKENVDHIIKPSEGTLDARIDTKVDALKNGEVKQNRLAIEGNQKAMMMNQKAIKNNNEELGRNRIAIAKINACPYEVMSREADVLNAIETTKNFLFAWEAGEKVASRQCVAAIVVFLKHQYEKGNADVLDAITSEVAKKLYSDYPYYVPVRVE